MLYQNVCIEGMGYVIPDHVVTSAWLEEQIAPVYTALHIPFGYLERLTGIKERRWWDDDILVSDASAMATERAIANAGIDRREIQCLVNASVCRDYIEPATAAIVHHKVGLDNAAMSFDIVNACLGFLNGMMTIANMIELRQIDAGVVAAAENPKEGQLATIDYMLNHPPSKATIRDNMASLTLGAASVAMVLCHKSKSKTGKQLVGGATYSNTQHNQLCVAQRTWMRTNSSLLLSEGTKVVTKAWQFFKEEIGWKNSTVDKMFTHQISEPQRKIGLKAIGVPPDIDHPTLHYLGNTASVAAPISMAIGIDNGIVEEGDKVVLFGVGSGINSVVLGIQW
ncbi:MAG TPA: 3-oxoacyl-ACP synthase III [Anaerolineae bacterium]|nr:3-oxoacyl-ACP synthase III [Anaerolineae bacterium]HQH36996.1 3-oxoacyl-ACP synthase III [Anaerolineae bacterium]